MNVSHSTLLGLSSWGTSTSTSHIGEAAWLGTERCPRRTLGWGYHGEGWYDLVTVSMDVPITRHPRVSNKWVRNITIRSMAHLYSSWLHAGGGPTWPPNRHAIQSQSSHCLSHNRAFHCLGTPDTYIDILLSALSSYLWAASTSRALLDPNLR